MTLSGQSQEVNYFRISLIVQSCTIFIAVTIAVSCSGQYSSLNLVGYNKTSFMCGVAIGDCRSHFATSSAHVSTMTSLQELYDVISCFCTGTDALGFYAQLILPTGE
jgi:hypothetical protein